MSKTTKTPAKKTNDKSEEVDSALLDLFVDELKDIYWAEKHLVKALPKMQKAASSEELQQAIGNHIEQTKVHVTRLEEVFGLLDEKAVAKKCDAMAGLVEEGRIHCRGYRRRNCYTGRWNYFSFSKS